MDTKRNRRKLFMFGCSVMFVLTFLLHADRGFAAEPLPVADLEQGFWVCDYVATTRGMDSTPIGLCVAIMDELKARKFGGDFDELVGWWRQNKVAEHQKLEATLR